MNIVMWIIAGFLAVMFLVSGVVKIMTPRERLSAYGLGALESLSSATIKAIGGLEILGAVGLILPAALDVAPVFVPLAAAGLAALMGSAFVFHVRRRETQGIVVTLVLLALAAVVAWGRFGPESFTG